MNKTDAIPLAEPRRIPVRVFKVMQQIDQCFGDDRALYIANSFVFDYWVWRWFTAYCVEPSNGIQNFAYIRQEYIRWKVTQ